MRDIQTPLNGIHSKLEPIRVKLTVDEGFCSVSTRKLRNMFYYSLSDPIDNNLYFPLTNKLENEQDTSW